MDGIVIRYARTSAPSAGKLATALTDAGVDIRLSRAAVSDSRPSINWGRRQADTDLNPDITNSVDKLRMRQLFAEAGVPMPRLFSLNEAANYTLAGGTVVARRRNHTRGKGFWRCGSIDDLWSARASGAKIFMEYIDAPHEYRVHIFDGKSIRVSEKSFFEPNGYVTIKPTGEVSHVRKAAKQAVKALGMDFGAVDVLATDDAAWVLEVNAAPGIGGTVPQVYAAAIENWLEYN